MPDPAPTDPDRPSGTRRRGVLAAAGGSAAGLLAGCAAYGNTGSAASSSAPAGTAAADGGAAPALTSLADVPVGGGVILTSARIVVTQPQAGTVRAFSAVCTHAGCVVTSVSGGTINCPCHGSRYRIQDGSVSAGPAPAPLPPVSVTVRNGEVVRA